MLTDSIVLDGLAPTALGFPGVRVAGVWDMRADALAGAVGFAGLMLGVLALLPPAPVVQLRSPRIHYSASAFPPSHAARSLRVSVHGGGPAALALDREIARLGHAPARLEPLRRAFLESTNLLQFALDRLPPAAAGDGASQYFIYLALDQCRSYLRNEVDGAGANLDRIMSLPDLTAEERIAFRFEYERCRAFSMDDWSAIGDALGDDRSGAEVEYASVWFERAALAGYGPALAEQALRPSPYGAAERAAMLREALPDGGAEVYWLLFAHSGEAQAGEINVPALAWLIVACRAGQDCSETARWYHGFVCTEDPRRCAPGQSALEYYWLAASPQERDQAWSQAFEIEGYLESGRLDDLPLPDLESLDYHHTLGGPGNLGVVPAKAGTQCLCFEPVDRPFPRTYDARPFMAGRLAGPSFLSKSGTSLTCLRSIS